ncbi:MAG: glycerol kinase GlpK [Oscillospiraceae bacterium]|nr:glycerol kinase GlpK [Oscillospiraceae bacterium]
MNGYVLAVDQGTTSSRAILFDKLGNIVSMAQYPITQHYPSPGWVEHDPMEILSTELLAMEEVYEKSGLSPTDITAIGITNQRETTIIWDKATGKPVSNAIVWQCRRTAGICEKLKADGLSETVLQKTGLLIDPYFSGTKIRWILDQEPTLQRRAEQGELLFGNVESWLIWNLTGGAAHVTDYSNASRTMLFDIDKLCWDEELCSILNIPRCMLPTPVPSSMIYGTVAPTVRGLAALAGTPIAGSIGDQPAALFGQGCFLPGQAKNTYGTGCFTLLNIGSQSARSHQGMVTSVGWSLGGEVSYAIEGSAFNAGSAIQWLRDECKIIAAAHECDILAETLSHNDGVYFVPAFTGLGAPYWDTGARGSFFGMTRGTGKAHMCRAVLESIAYEVMDLVTTMETESGTKLRELRVDGGASVSDFMMQFQADLLDLNVIRPTMVETTAAGAAFMAGLATGVWSGTEELSKLQITDRVFRPDMAPELRQTLAHNWHTAVDLSRQWGRLAK